jgi:hypothetical protein
VSNLWTKVSVIDAPAHKVPMVRHQSRLECSERDLDLLFDESQAGNPSRSLEVGVRMAPKLAGRTPASSSPHPVRHNPVPGDHMVTRQSFIMPIT